MDVTGFSLYEYEYQNPFFGTLDFSASCCGGNGFGTHDSPNKSQSRVHA